MRAPDFRVPTPERIGWRNLPLILVLHLGLLWVLQWSGQRPPLETARRVVRLIQLTNIPTFVPPDRPIPWEQLDLRGGPTVTSVDVNVASDEGVPELVRAPEAVALAEVVAVPREVPTVVAPPAPRPVEVTPRPGTNRRLGAAFGDGRFWIPSRLTARERVEVAITVAQIDSVLRDRLLAAIDALPPDSFAIEEGPDSWSATILGEEFGIDAQFITIAGIKIPSMLLALLPLNLPEGNIFDARAGRRDERNRREIIENAQRQEDLADIRRYIQEMRERKDAERELRKALEVRKDTIVTTRDSIIR